MSVLTKKHPISTSSGLRAHAASAARQVGPLASKTMPKAQLAAHQAAQQAQLAAQQAAPLAKTATTSVRHSADGAVAWATPKVDAARAWAAPQLEQSAHTITESLAPMISGALINAAHKIDAPVRKKPRRRSMITWIALLVTAAAGAAIVAMRLREPPAEFTAAPATDGAPPDPDMNGQSKIV